MKKYLLVSFLFYSFISPVFSQINFRFADSTAQWNVLETWQGLCWCYTWDTHVMKVQGDTIFNNENYQVIGFTNNSLPPLETSGKYYIRKDSLQKVYGKVNGDSADYLIYDFSKQAGDSFSIGLNYLSAPSIKIHVDSVSFVFWKYNRKVMHVSAEAIGIFPFAIVEGIGALNSFFLYPGVEYSFLDGPSYSLLCYFENDTVVYHSPYHTGCVIDSSWTGINELSKRTKKISTSAGSDFINIQLQHDPREQTILKLFDICGKMTLQKQLSEEINRIDLIGVSKGIYIYDVSTFEQKLASGKVVVQ